MIEIKARIGQENLKTLLNPKSERDAVYSSGGSRGIPNVVLKNEDSKLILYLERGFSKSDSIEVGTPEGEYNFILEGQEYKVIYKEVIFYSDLPKYLGIAINYGVDVSIGSLQDHLDRYRESYELDLDPDFQRPHVWTEKQQVQFTEHIFKGGQSGREIYFNCPGFQSHGEISAMVLVDGKQRLEALRRFTNNEFQIFDKYYFKDLTLPFDPKLRFVVNNLPTKKEVLQWYLEMNTGGTPHTTEEIDRVREMYNKS